MFVVRSVTVPEKLTGMPCNEVDTLPVPHATELSLVVLVTVTVTVPRPWQLSDCSVRPALAAVAATNAGSTTNGSARRRPISILLSLLTRPAGTIPTDRRQPSGGRLGFS